MILFLSGITKDGGLIRFMNQFFKIEETVFNKHISFQTTGEVTNVSPIYHRKDGINERIKGLPK